MKHVWFVVPVHGREDLTRVCLRQLRRTCDAAKGVHATAVVIGEGENLKVAESLGFATVQRNNHQLGTKFNDGYQLACDPDYNPRPADYAIPCGSDDWVDPVLLNRLPENQIGVFKHLAVVNPERTKVAELRVGYMGGAGIRIIPSRFIANAGYRPAEEDRERAIDTSTLHGLSKANRWGIPPIVQLDVHSKQIVDWKSHSEQLNGYELLRHFHTSEHDDPYTELAAHYPADALEEMRSL